jgi:hypothetical protein
VKYKHLWGIQKQRKKRERMKRVMSTMKSQCYFQKDFLHPLDTFQFNMLIQLSLNFFISIHARERKIEVFVWMVDTKNKEKGDKPLSKSTFFLLLAWFFFALTH